MCESLWHRYDLDSTIAAMATPHSKQLACAVRVSSFASVNASMHVAKLPCDLLRIVNVHRPVKHAPGC